MNRVTGQEDHSTQNPETTYNTELLPHRWDAEGFVRLSLCRLVMSVVCAMDFTSSHSVLRNPDMKWVLWACF
jgi:hypothetical protein